ncbi:GGDEF domain-containing protein [Paracidovorax valerianellae]|uniref:diguanylate cyclase n=1 Tax=Paracidovorax valerianellae TaxID=187868 RepID=A0A1G6WK67_9BURK|nr:GGDEF domain-containing protein [Paracidovorax valerianellae]MDA8447567.1 diguanylate cyclase [Paracidovorax valerianellae]SDD65617.1 diguanylate cyclase [Paracidovorax valerianellae]
MAERPPSELARETLKQLAARRLPPTPDNYQALYDEIAGNPSAAPFPQGPLRHILRVLPGQTPGQKRLLGQLESAIENSDWTQLQSVFVGYANLGLASIAATPLAAASAEPVTATHLPEELTEQLARLIDNTLPALGEDDARVLELAAQLTNFLRQPSPPISTFGLMLNNFSYRVSFATEDQAAIRSSLLELLHMLFENIAVLSQDDRWLQGQVEALMAASTPPLTLRRLDEVQRRLKDVIFKQTEAKERTVQAQEQMKELLATFIERLVQITASSSTYHDKMEHCAERIGQATSLQEITPLLEEVMSATRAMALDSRVARDELQDLRERSDARHAEIAKLQEELDRASAQARHDPLTGSLNRKGLDEVMEREIARAVRNGSPLCVALLDVDNFKLINDRLGHTAGDEALVHLAGVTREVMRPQDMLARYGGEEFVLVLPDTALHQGVEAMTRLQRELTTRYFLKDREKVLITFSAGVAQLAEQESSTEAIRRADQGMYLAKRAGKNRVMAS